MQGIEGVAGTAMQYDGQGSQIVQLTARWLELLRSGREGQAEAARFYEQELLPVVRAQFVEKHRQAFLARYFGMIFSVGTSWQPEVLSWSAAQPTRSLFLCSGHTEVVLDRIVSALGLKSSQYDKETVDDADPTKVYEAVKRFYQRWHKYGKLAIDFTGGTKAMTSGVAMAGAVLGLDLLYVANTRYLEEVRAPAPGSEYLTVVPNPLTVFGDLEEQEAFRLAARHEWVAVRQVAEALDHRLPSPRFRALSFLAAAYEEWDGFNIPEASKTMAALVAWLDSRRWDSLLPAWASSHRQRMKQQAALLDQMSAVLSASPGREAARAVLSAGDVVAGLVASLLANAQRKVSQGMRDLAALLLYRTVELMAQRRIHRYGGDPSDLTPSPFPAPHNDATYLLSAINERRTRLHLEPLRQLPRQPGAVMLYVILDVLNDPFVQRLPLGEVAGYTEARNYGFLAHGFTVTDVARYQRLWAFTEKVARRFYEVEGLNYDEWLEAASFVMPGPAA